MSDTYAQRVKLRCITKRLRALDIVACVAGILWPDGDEAHDWDADTLEQIARVFHDHALKPSDLD